VTKGRVELPCLSARRSERRVSASFTTWSESGVGGQGSGVRESNGRRPLACPFVPCSFHDPCGDRTRLCDLRGRCPEPIDERAESNWVVKELNLASSTSLFCDNGFTGRREEHNPKSGTGGSRTRRSPNLELGRFASLRTVPQLKASPTGFEPVISCLTGRRALQAAPRGRN
jgi:hypothetical protein